MSWLVHPPRSDRLIRHWLGFLGGTSTYHERWDGELLKLGYPRYPRISDLGYPYYTYRDENRSWEMSLWVWACISVCTVPRISERSDLGYPSFSSSRWDGHAGLALCMLWKMTQSLPPFKTTHVFNLFLFWNRWTVSILTSLQFLCLRLLVISPFDRKFGSDSDIIIKS